MTAAIIDNGINCHVITEVVEDTVQTVLKADRIYSNFTIQKIRIFGNEEVEFIIDGINVCIALITVFYFMKIT